MKDLSTGSIPGHIATMSIQMAIGILVQHEPRRGEVFDPSVAAEEEPPGWVWMEGRLVAAGGQALLCDPGADCVSGAVARGIDPAKVLAAGSGLDGLFYGRIRDGAIDELQYVPHSEARR